MDQLARRRILACVTGLTPQVVTETLYALLKENDGAMPTELRLITTANGRNRCLRDLLDPVDGKFLQFCREFGLGGRITFDAEHIAVIQDRDGNELEDIRSPEENTCAADFIMDCIRCWCEDGDASLHLSIAGGRKSMGFLAGYALSIFGRPGDRLTHVLANAPFENNRDFFYPSKLCKPLFAQDGTPLDMDEAEISLADIPFIRLRSGLTAKLLESNDGFSQTVSEAQKSIAPDVSAVVEFDQKTVILGNTSVKLSAVNFCTYCWFLKLQREGRLPAAPNHGFGREEFLHFSASILGKYSQAYTNMEAAVSSDEYFLAYVQQRRSRIRQLLDKTLGKLRAETYAIQSNKKRLNIKYFLNIPANKISLF